MGMLGEIWVKFGLNTKDFDKKIAVVAKDFKDVGKDMKKVGQDLTRSVTIPLTILGAVMLKTASDSNEMKDEFDALKKSMTGALRETTSAFKPFIALFVAGAQKMTDNVRGLASAFSALPEPLRMAVGLFGLVLAAAGPLLVIMGGLATATGVALVGAVKAAVVAFGPLILAIGAGVAAGALLARIFTNYKFGALTFSDSAKDMVDSNKVFVDGMNKSISDIKAYGKQLEDIEKIERIFGKTSETIGQKMALARKRIEGLVTSGREGENGPQIKQEERRIELLKEEQEIYKKFESSRETMKKLEENTKKLAVQEELWGASIDITEERIKGQQVAMEELALSLGKTSVEFITAKMDLAALQKQLENQKMWKDFSDSAQRAWNTLSDGFSDAVANTIVAGQNLREAMAQVFQQIAADAIKNIVNSVMKMTLGKFLNIVGGAVSGAFGKVAGGAAGGVSANVGSVGPRRMADGGIVSSPTFALVGESGPEAVIPLSQMDKVGGQTVIQNTFQIQSLDTSTEESVILRQRKTIERMFKDSISRGGEMTFAVRSAVAR